MMASKNSIATALILSIVTSAAEAGPAYYAGDSGSDTFVLIIAGVFVAICVIGIIIGLNAPAPPPRAKSADEYNAEATLLAAKRHHTEIMTELRKAEIEAARIEAIHKECGEIIAHDRKVRDLNARLQERRRSS